MKQWIVNRVGLLNFWYYQNQIFEFSDGRMLLRGTNGSGKSLTMQSLFPVLLDGDTRAGRLDSFGSQDRKMLDYLLGEKGVSERDEGTGYLFLEVKRIDREEYLTVGIGMYAKRGGTLKKWFFTIENNQRIGIDFELYEEPRKNEIIPNTKRKLTNRLVGIGRVFETQRAYKLFVNERIFGFEDIEQFEELIELLINLRNPKLSRDFKPSVIYKILHDSLPKLKDDELLTLSKTIEQLDGHRDRLEDLGNEIKDLKQFTKLYGRFKQEHNGQIAGKWFALKQEVEHLTSENQKKQRTIQREERMLEKTKQTIDDHQSQLIALNQSILELNQHEGMNLVQRGQELQEQLDMLQTQFAKNSKRVEQKQERMIEQKKQLEEQELQVLAYLKALDEYLIDNEQYVTYLRLEEFDATYANKMRTQISDEDYRYWQQEIQRKKRQLEEIQGDLRKYDALKEQFVIVEREVANLQQQVDEMQRDIRQWQQTRQAEIESWKQAFENWRQQAHFEVDIVKSNELLYRMDQLLEEEIREEYILEPIRQSYELAREESQHQIIPLKNKRMRLLEKQKEKINERLEWENKKTPEPFQTADRQKNRERLNKRGSYVSFYQSVDFIKEVTVEQQQRIEGALYASGILDSVVSSEGLTLASDLQILPKPVFFGSTLADYLIVSPETPTQLQPLVADVIQSILYDEISDGNPTIFSDGKYQVTNLIGAMPENYQASYIGAASQERYRQQMLDLLQIELEQLVTDITQIEVEIEKLIQLEQQMLTDYHVFPRGTEVYQSIAYLSRLNLELQAKNNEQEGKQIERNEKEQSLMLLRTDLHKKSTKFGLNLTQDTYQEAIIYAQNYESNLNDAYQNYLLHLAKKPNIETLGDTIASLEEEIDELQHEIKEISAEITKQERVIVENLKQQKLVNVEELQQQLLRAKDEQKERESQLIDLRKEELRLTGVIATNYTQLQMQEAQLEKNQFQEAYWHQLCHKRFVTDDLLSRVKEVALPEDNVKLRDLSDRVIRQFNFIVDQLGNYQPKILNNIDVELPEEIEKKLGDFSQYNHYKEPIFVADNQNHSTFELLDKLVSQQMILQDLSKKEDEKLFKTIILESVGKVLRSRIQQSLQWVGQMNELLQSRKNSSGLTLSIQWKPVTSENANDLGTAKLVELLQKPVEILSEADRQAIAQHFQEKVYYAQEFTSNQTEEQTTLFQAITQALDYRDWFQFEMKYKRANEGYSPQVLSDSQFNKFSGGEKAIAMYLPLFAAVYSRYLDAEEWCPRVITLDEAFAGIDDENISDLFEACEELGFNYVMNSQALFGDYPTVSSLMIYELLRPQNTNLVTPIRYHWDGQTKHFLPEQTYG